MRRNDACFERYARIQGYSIDKTPSGRYVASDTETLRRGFMPGFLAGIKEALMVISELEEETEP